MKKTFSARVVRFILWTWVHCFYKVEILGHENLKSLRAAILVANHLSYADSILLSSCTSRQIRFWTWREIFNLKGLRWFFRVMKCIPISPTDGPRKMMTAVHDARRELLNGELVGIFAEGQISRTGRIDVFKRGLTYVAKDIQTPIIPVFIDGVWGSVFSFSEGKFFWKRPTIKRLKISISFGTPLPPTATPQEIRERVVELGENLNSGLNLKPILTPVTF